DDHRVDTALAVREQERVSEHGGAWGATDVDRVAVDDVENARALVLGGACADRQVKQLEARRSPGRLAEQTVALRPRCAVALDAPSVAVPTLNRSRDPVDQRRAARGSAIERRLGDAVAVLRQDDVAG